MTITWVAKVQVPKIQDSRLYLAKCSTLCSRMQAQRTKKSPTWSRLRMRITPPLLIRIPTMSVSQAWIMNQLIIKSEVHPKKENIVWMVAKILRSKKRTSVDEFTIHSTFYTPQAYWAKEKTSKCCSTLMVSSVRIIHVRTLRRTVNLALSHRLSMVIEANKI